MTLHQLGVFAMLAEIAESGRLVVIRDGFVVIL